MRAIRYKPRFVTTRFAIGKAYCRVLLTAHETRCFGSPEHTKNIIEESYLQESSPTYLSLMMGYR